MRLLRFAVSIIIVTSAGVLSALPKKAYPEETIIVESGSGFRVQESEHGVKGVKVKRDIVQDIEEKRENIRRDIRADRQDFKESTDPSIDKARIHKKKKELHNKISERKYDSHKLNQDRGKKRRNIRGDIRDATREKQKRYHAGPEPIRKEHRGIKK